MDEDDGMIADRGNAEGPQGTLGPQGSEKMQVLPVIVLEGGPKLRGIVCQVPLGVLTVDATVTETMGPYPPRGFEVIWPKAEEMLQQMRAEIRERPRIAIATGPLPPVPQPHRKHR
jgi:hypothetical protein